MGTTCQKQFENVPLEESTYQYTKQRERIQTNSIKMQHKIFKPNTKRPTFGVIDSMVESQINTSPEYLHLQNSYGNQSLVKANLEGSKVGYSNGLDREELQATKRPFMSADKVRIAQDEMIFTSQEHGERERLSLDFFYSLGLPEYVFENYPGQVAHLFKNLPVCEQQDRYGVRYIGEWSRDLKLLHGNGVMQSNVTKYIGQFKDGVKQFHGRQIETKQVYQGQFVRGKRKGKGIRYTPTQIEEGIFDNFLVNGTIKYEDQTVYTGQLKNNKYDGQGEFSNKISSISHRGHWVNGKLEGKGLISRNGQLIYEGLFQNDMKQGYGKYYWSKDYFYQGKYSRDKKHDPNGILRKGNLQYHGSFENGQMNGLFRVFEQNANQRLQERKPISFNHGVICDENIDPRELAQLMNLYKDKIVEEDPEPSILSVDGMPEQWKQVVNRV